MRAIGNAIALALLAGCAGSGTLVAVLPPEEGQSVGGVRVIDEEGAVIETFDQPNTQAVARRGTVRKGEAQGTVAIAADLEVVLPARPTLFILYFNQGSDRLTADSEVLTALFDEVMRRPGAEVEVVGHTDTMGDMVANDELSIRRAEAVVDLFVQRGFDRSAMRATGRGERVLRVPTGDEVANLLNSRVEVYVR